MTRALALLALLAAAPAAAAPAHAPCLVVRDSLEAHVAAFEAEGWTLATGAAREAALPGLAQAEVFRQLYAQVIDALPPQDDPAAFEAEALRLAAGRLAESAILTRGGAALALRLLPGEDGGTYLTCALAAPDLPEAEARLAATGADPSPRLRDEVLLSLEELEPPPPGAAGAILAAYLYQGPLSLAGAESVLVLLRSGSAP